MRVPRRHAFRTRTRSGSLPRTNAPGWRVATHRHTPRSNSHLCLQTTSPYAYACAGVDVEGRLYRVAHIGGGTRESLPVLYLHTTRLPYTPLRTRCYTHTPHTPHLPPHTTTPHTAPHLPPTTHPGGVMVVCLHVVVCSHVSTHGIIDMYGILL